MKELENLAEVLKDNSHNLLRGVTVVLEWEKVAEATIAAETEALKFEYGVLFVEVSSSAWASELSFLKEKILEKLNKHFGKKIVKDIKFLVKGVSHGKRKGFRQPI